MSSFEPWQWLDAHVNLESVGVPAGVPRRLAHPTLERMQALAALLGSPQLEYPVIHVTGTNGKTSAARLAAMLLVAHGFSVGSYTSPNLERVNERIAWNGEEIDDATLVDLLRVVSDIEPYLPDRPSYFEILTGAAFEYFADVAVDAAVIEVGVGGLWDATNVADGRVAVVTNVTIDHVDYLGPTRADIAREKAGIVKPGSTLVLGETEPDLVAIFEASDPERLVVRDRDFMVRSNAMAHGGRLVTMTTPYGAYEDVFLSLHGSHQADNAVVAVTAVESLLDRALDDAMVRAVFGAARSPGRLEVVGHQPLVLLDGAHNVDAAQHLVAALAEEFPTTQRITVVGLLREKDPVEMLRALGVASSAHLVCCRAPSPRARPPDEIAAAAVELGLDPGTVEVVEDVADAVERARRLAAETDQIVVTGSLYVVGAARAALLR